MSTCIGIDGCKGGWLFTIFDDSGKVDIKLYAKIKDAIEDINAAKIIAIDMPIGLVEVKGEERQIDLDIRKELGHPFSSSVFAVPCKQAVYANDYHEANQINKDVLGKGISVQAWNICAKIIELDILLTQYSHLKFKFKEMHPELCFKRIQGSSLKFKKKTNEGVEERMNLLKIKHFDVKGVYEMVRKEFFKKDVANDDFLDSLVLAFSLFN